MNWHQQHPASDNPSGQQSNQYQYPQPTQIQSQYSSPYPYQQQYQYQYPLSHEQAMQYPQYPQHVLYPPDMQQHQMFPQHLYQDPRYLQPNVPGHSYASTQENPFATSSLPGSSGQHTIEPVVSSCNAFNTENSASEGLPASQSESKPLIQLPPRIPLDYNHPSNKGPQANSIQQPAQQNLPTTFEYPQFAGAQYYQNHEQHPAMIPPQVSPVYHHHQQQLQHIFPSHDSQMVMLPGSSYLSPAMPSMPPPVPPPPMQPPLPMNTSVAVNFESYSLFGADTRAYRPPRICIILRGYPFSGKSWIAKKIKDLEKESSSMLSISASTTAAATRIFSIDDYFSSDGGDKEDTALSKLLDNESLEMYSDSMFKTTKKSLEEGKFELLIVDACNVSLQTIREINHCVLVTGGKYKVMVATLPTKLSECLKRFDTFFSRSEKPAERIQRARDVLKQFSEKYELIPEDISSLDLTWILKGGNVEDCDMEEAESLATPRSFTEEDEDEDDLDEEEEGDTIAVPARNEAFPSSSTHQPSNLSPQSLAEGLNRFRKRRWDVDESLAEAPQQGPTGLKGILVVREDGSENGQSPAESSSRSNDGNERPLKKRKSIRWGDPIDDGGLREILDGNYSFYSQEIDDDEEYNTSGSITKSKWDESDDEDDADDESLGLCKLLGAASSERKAGRSSSPYESNVNLIRNDSSRGFEIGAVSLQKAQEKKRLEEEERLKVRQAFLQRVQDEQRQFREALQKSSSSSSSSTSAPLSSLLNFSARSSGLKMKDS